MTLVSNQKMYVMFSTLYVHLFASAFPQSTYHKLIWSVYKVGKMSVNKNNQIKQLKRQWA